jgi:hypothetical protein
MMLKRLAVVSIVSVFGVVLSGAVPAAAHVHSIIKNGQVIANGQNHPKFINGVACESYGPAGSIPIGPAWYGLESAHHGPDAGDPGRADGCYQTTGSVPPADDQQNPAIH